MRSCKSSQNHRRRTSFEEAKIKLRLLYRQSLALRLWKRLDTFDFINRGMLLSAILLLCFIPFMITLNSLAGHSTATSIIQHFGLTPEAARIIQQTFTTPANTTASLNAASYVFFVLGGIAVAASIQDIYERIFKLSQQGMRSIPRQFIWLLFFISVGWFFAWVAPKLHQAGGPFLLACFGLVALILFWLLSMRLLLAGRIPWRQLLPSAIATGVCWVGMSIFFKFYISRGIIAYYHKYGTIGVTFAFMSYLIAIGVVIILGAMAGLIWQERRGE